MTATKKTTTAKAAPKEAAAAALNGYEDFVALGQGNVDAFVKSGELLAKGLQEFGKVWFDLAQASTQESTNAAQTVMACKTLPEVLEVQGKLGQGSYAKLLSNGQKLSDMSTKLVEEVSQPIGERVNVATVAMEKFTKPLAA